MTEEIEIHREVGSIAAEWDELAVRADASPFDRPGWFSAWLDAFGSAGLEITTLRRDGRLAAVLPTISHRGVVRSPTNWHSPGFTPVAEDREARRSAFAALRRHWPRRVDLSFVDPATAADLREAWSTKGVERIVHDSPNVDTDREWEPYWQGLSKNLRSTVRRRRKRLAELGEMEIEVVTGGPDLPALLDRCFELEAGGWKGEKGTAILSTPETLRFYTALAGWAAEAGLLSLCLLRLDGSVVAFNYSLEDERHHYLLKLGHDVALNEASPGTVLTAAMVERAFAGDLQSYEFLGEPDRYKLQWASGSHKVFRAQVFSRSPLGLGDRIVQTRGRSLALRVLRRG